MSESTFSSYSAQNSRLTDAIERHQRLAPFIAAAVALLLGLMIVEILCRFIVEQEDQVGTPKRLLFTEYDPTYGWRLRKNFEGTNFQSEGDGVSYFINSDGYRGAPVKERVGRSRVLIIGESTGFGLGVEGGQVFSNLLSQHLQNKVRNGVELINVSVPGYSFDQELLKLENEGKKYSPELVLLVLSTDTIYSIRYPAHRLLYPDTVTDYAKPYFLQTTDEKQATVLQLENQPPAETFSEDRVEYWKMQHTPEGFLGVMGRYLSSAEYLHQSLKYINTEHLFGRPEIYPAYQSNSENWQLLLQLLYRFKDLSKRLQAAEMLVILPTKETFTMERVYPMAHHRLKLGCIQAQIHCVDLLNEIQGGGGKTLYAGRYLNVEGHQTVKNALEEPVQTILNNIQANRR